MQLKLNDLKSYSKSPSVLARCWRLIRDSALKELFFILSVPLPMKETPGRQWPKEIEKHLPFVVECPTDVKKQQIWLNKMFCANPEHNVEITFV